MTIALRLDYRLVTRLSPLNSTIAWRLDYRLATRLSPRDSTIALRLSTVALRLYALLPCPLHEARPFHAELPFERWNVDVVADTVEPLQHDREVFAVFADVRDGDLDERNISSEAAAQMHDGVRYRQRVGREIDFTAIELVRVGESAGDIPADVVDRDHLQLEIRAHRRVNRVAIEEPGRQQVLHEEHGPENHVRRKAGRPNRFLDAELVVEVRNAGLPMRGSDR